MESSLVIKVQYGDTLRRFNARIIGSDNLDLDMLGLKAKIFNLFNIPSDADVTLTYFDEDGDIVTLVDDDDLRDVMRQNLKYLKIIVSSSTERVGISYVRSSGSSTPLRSPSVQPPLPNVNAIVAEALKSVPETVQGALSKISSDFISKASSTSPSVADLIEQLAKMGAGNLSAGSASASRGSESASAVAPATAADGTNDTQMPTDVLPKVASTSVFKEAPISESLGATAAVAPSAGTYQQPIDLNADPPVTLNPTTGLKGPQKCRKRDLVGVKPSGSSTSTCPPESTAPKGNSTQATGYSHIFSPCPFSGVPLLNEPSLPSHSMHHGKRGFKSTDYTGAVFHKGIRCDGCGILPITGPRYKSLVKEDYDLCSICFEEKGRECDYIRIDKPISYRSMKLKQLPHPWVPPVLPHVFRPGSKRGHPKLDSRFVSDVTIMDGTVMAPSTPFTKIWRMRNNGNFVWSAGTRLVWIGGDNFSKKNCVDIEIPPLGVNVEAELDIALDFVAPASPGRYISYWRMASPSGHKFGQRVWVLIQVETTPDVSAPKIPGALNLNLPPETIGSILHEMNSQLGDGFDETLGQSSQRGVGKSASFEEFLGPSYPTRVGELEKLSAEKQHGKEQEDNFPINDALLVGNVGSTSASPESSVSISYPVISPSDIGEIASSVSAAPTAPAVATEPVPVPVAEAESSAKGVMEASNSNDVRDESDIVEESLLKELAEMGFKQVDLNKEVLRMNSYDMEQSVEDLCGVSEWDPILEELQEMGFCDKEKNKMLLKKNDGSIRRVVMDLLTGESDDSAVTH